MSCQFKNFAIVSLVLISLSACGGKDTTNTVPQAEDPNWGAQQPLPQTGPRVDARLPEWTKRSAPISLKVAGNYSDLGALVLAPGDFVTLPIVGDPLIAMDIVGGTSTQVDGNLYLGIEDKDGFAWREWTSLKQMSFRNASVTDMWFMDDEVVVRATGPVGSDGKYKGDIDFRFRQSGETQCESTTVTWCDYQPYCRQPAPNGGCYVPWEYYCVEQSRVDFDAAACQSYMSSSNSSVRRLGKFEVMLSKWLK